MISSDTQERIDTAISRIQDEKTLESFASERSRALALVIVDNSPLPSAFSRRARAIYHLRKRLKLLEGI